MNSSSLQHHAAFWSGAAAVAWVGAQYAVGQHLGLFVTLLILAFYLVGAVELQRERRATTGLADNLRALTETPSDLSTWLLNVPAGLQTAVRQRVESGTAALPHASLTPYLVGLLVLLGMLGTFLGMVVTLNGTGTALQIGTDPQAIRGSLAGPVKGLGLAFGTSVAGVAASAMLGLMAALSRGERARVQHLLDHKIASTLRTFSPSFQREQSLRLLHRQAECLPLVADRLTALMEGFEQKTVRLHESLQASQVQVNEQLHQSFNNLAASVHKTFEHGVAQIALTTREAVCSAAESTLSAVSLQGEEMSRTLTAAFVEQLREQSNRFSETASEASRRCISSIEHQDSVLTENVRRAGDLLHVKVDAVQQMLTRTMGEMERLQAASAQQSSLFLEGVSRDSAKLLQRNAEQVATQVEQLVTRLTEWEQRRESAMESRIADQTAALQHQWQQLARDLATQQSAMVGAMEEASRTVLEQTLAQTTGVLEKVRELTLASRESHSLTKKALVEVQEVLAERMAQDKASFLEQRKVIDALNQLLVSTTASANEQRAAIESLTSSAAGAVDASLEQLRAQSDRESTRLDCVAAQVSASAVEVASLGEAFGAAVEGFSNSSGELTKQLERVEAALARSLTRSDEQLAYYVAQAREVIDLSLMSQKQIMEDLQRLGDGQRSPTPVGATA